MMVSPALREKLPSALAAIALQVGLLALLALSFEVVQRVVAGKETILVLPPLAVPRPTPPRVIDARPRRSSPPAAPAAPVQAPVAAPAPIAPPQSSVSEAPAPAQGDCVPQGERRPANRVLCPPVVSRAPANPDEIPLHPETHVKNAPIWQSEIERRNTPPRVPCVSLTSTVVGMGGFEKQDSGARIDVGCALKEWRDPHLLPPVNGTPAPDPRAGRASDEAFVKALQAVNARKLALSGKPAATGAAP